MFLFYYLDDFVLFYFILFFNSQERLVTREKKLYSPHTYELYETIQDDLLLI